MTRTRNNMFKMLTSIAIVVLMSLSMILPALAERPDYNSGVSSEKPAEAAITKIFKMPIGTTTPEVDFYFTFTAVNVDGKGDSTGMPTIPQQKISFTAANVGVVENGDKIVIKESGNFLETLESADWGKVGIFKYTVTEVKTGAIPENDVEGGAYSQAEYDLYIWVDIDGDNKYYAKYVYAVTVKDYVDEYYPGQEGGDKVNPEPGEWVTKEVDDLEEWFSGLIFTNKYWKTDGKPDPDKSAFEVTKTVAGLIDDEDDIPDFVFKVTVIKPSLVVGDPKYKARVYDADGEIVTSTYHYVTLVNGYIEFKSGEPLDVKLRDGERLAFVDLHVGSVVKVLELAADGYIPSYSRTFGEDLTPFIGEINKDYGFPREDGIRPDKGPHYIPEGNYNEANFINTRSGSIPTGLDVDDLPYIVLIGLAVAGLIGFIAVKFRKRAEYDA